MNKMTAEQMAGTLKDELMCAVSCEELRALLSAAERCAKLEAFVAAFDAWNADDASLRMGEEYYEMNRARCMLSTRPAPMGERRSDGIT